MEEANGATVDVNGGAINGVAPAEGETGEIMMAEVVEEGPPSMIGLGPPSPLTGCYLLIVIGEPYSQEHKDIIIQRLVKGFLSWDVSDCHVDLEEELNTITLHAPEGEEARHGERLIQYASENLVTEILIHPQYNTLIQCMRNLMSSFTRHRHIIHAGYTFSGNGSWILQDGTFSVADFSEAFQEHEVQRVLRAYPETITMDIHCAAAGLWTALPEKSYAKLCKIRINPVDVLNSGSDKINAFIDYLAPMMSPASLHELLETSDVVGNIRFSHPTLYVFPGGQGDAALFGINGFNMLVDGGFNRKACFWDFARHLDRLDAVLMTRLNNCNINGISSVVERKQHGQVYPQIGHFFCNIPERKNALSPDGDKDRDPLLVDLNEKGHQLVANLHSINLKPQVCYRDVEPINLYHKVGHGTLDMYVISPSRDAKEVKEFLQKWAAGDSSLFMTRDAKEFSFPIQNLTSICALLVWQPANPEDTITRILFPGSTPDHKIIEGLDKIKHLEFMKYAVCSAKSLTPTLTQSAYAKKALKAAGPQILQDNIMPSKASLKPDKDNKILDNKLKSAQADNKIKENKLNGQLESSNEDLKMDKVKKAAAFKTAKPKLVEKKSDTDAKSDDDPKDLEVPKSVEDEKKLDDVTETESSKDTDGETKTKPKAEAKSKGKYVKGPIRSRIDSRPPKAMAVKKDEKSTKSSPTSTPKKTAAQDSKMVNGTTKAKTTSRPSPGSTPAKSAKEANNRKVLESKQKTTSASRAPAKPSEKKEPAKVDRKPISRRPKGESPPRRVGPGSPIKSRLISKDRDAKLRKTKIDKGGTTDSSLVSTPSADDAAKKVTAEIGEKEIDFEKQRELAELKEEQEAVREIEAVFKRDQEKQKLFADTSKQDSTTEADEEEEYLIIEKEEVEQYTEDSINEPESSMTKEEEIQKYQRDSEESEKKRKTSCEAAKEDEKHDPKVKIDEKPKVVQIIEGPVTIEKEAIIEDVQEIITSAKEIVKSKEEEISTPSPEDKFSSTKKTTEDIEQPEVAKDVAEQNLPESQPDEKISATIESGATTAPTLPEDERIPLDEIKEDLVIEEKYVKEETKEIELPESATAVASAPTPVVATSPPKVSAELIAERIVPAKMQFPAHQAPLRDIIKTPDEVADLPVHEEADYGGYDTTAAPESKDAVIADAKSKIETEVDRKELDDKTIEKEETKKTVPVKEEIQKDKPIKDDIKEKTPSPPGVKELVADAKDLVKQVKQTLAKEAEEKAAETQEKVEEKIAEVKDKITETKETIQDKVSITPERTEEKVQEIEEKIQVTDKLDEIAKGIDEKFKETAEKVDSKIAEITQEVEDVEEKAKAGLSTFLGDIADDIKSGIDKIEDLMKQTPSPEEKSLPGEILSSVPAYEIKGFTTELRETHITTLDSPVKEPERIIGTDINVLEQLPEAVDEGQEGSPPRGAMTSFKIEDIKFTGFEDTSLNDIKEEDEDERESPPRKTPEDTTIPTIIADKAPEISKLEEDAKTSEIKDAPRSPELKEPKRSISPRTPEEVAKIVANVAEVLKSDKDLEEIIPDFDPEELERKLSRESARSDTEATTVQRMLVTTSSEDGGEEIEICPQGSIVFSPEIASGKVSPDVIKDLKEASKPIDEKQHDLSLDMDSQKSSSTSIKSIPSESKPESGKSTPDIKTSPISIEEKDKHELSEKVQQKEVKEEPKTVSKIEIMDSKEEKNDESKSPAKDDESRRESVLSLLSEKDLTKDETSLGLSPKESSRPHSAASHASEKSIEEIEKDRDEKAADKIKGVDCEASPPKEVKDPSRPESALSAKESKEHSRPESTVQDKEKESSRPASRTSIKEETPATASKEPSRPESVIEEMKEIKTPLPSPTPSKEAPPSESVISTIDEDIKASSKEPSRPESASSDQKDKTTQEKEASRPESTASTKEEIDKASSKETSRPESALDDKKDKLSQSKEPSRPASVGSAKDEEVKVSEETSRPESALDDKKDKLSPSKQASRPASVGSATDEEVKVSKEISRPESALEDDKEKLSPSKQASRPESVASAKEEEIKTSSKEPSRPESAVDSEKEKLSSAKEASRPESVTSVKEEEVKATSKEQSRPESASSDHKDKMSSAKEASRPESTASTKEEVDIASSKETSRPESALEEYKDKLSQSKEPSRPASVGSAKDEEVKVSEETSRPESALDDKKDKLSPSKQASRPASVGSATDEEVKVSKEISRPESTLEDDKDKLSPSKQASRPESVASGKEEEIKTCSKELSGLESAVDSEKEKLSSAKEASRPESVTSVKEEEEVKGTSKEPSRPESASSDHKDKMSSAKEASRPESTASTKEEVDKASSKETSRPESVLEDDKDKLSPSKPSSRPESVASAKDEEIKTSSKEPSRPESAVDSEKEKLSSAKEASRPESVTSVKEEEVKATSKEQSRPESASSDHKDKMSSAKEVSRPESTASTKEEVDKASSKETSRPESALEDDKDKVSQSKEPSRPASVGSAKDEEIKTSSKEPSRPESASSDHQDKITSLKESSRPASVASTKDEEIKISSKELSRPESSTEDEKHRLSPAKESSRPGSVASVKEEVKITSKELSRPESALSDQKDETSLAEKHTKETSVSDVSTASVVKEEDKTSKEASRPESVSSGKEETNKLVEGESIIDEPSKTNSDIKESPTETPKIDTKEVSKEPSQLESAASLSKSPKPEEDQKVPSLETTPKTTPDAKECFRSESVTSDKDDKDDQFKQTHIVSKDSRPESSDQAIKPKDDSSKELSRPASVASHVSDKELSDILKDTSVSESAQKEEDTLHPESKTSETNAQEKEEDKIEKSKSEEASSPELKGSLMEEQTKESSRPESEIGKGEEEGKPVAESIKEPSRPESVASIKDESKMLAPSETPEKSLKSPEIIDAPSKTPDTVRAEEKKQSRPESVASIKDDVEQEKPSSREISPRPQLVASSETKSQEHKEPSRPVSAASHVSDVDEKEFKVESKETSRPASSTSHDNKEEKIPILETKESSRPESQQSHRSEKKQEFSRPSSVLSDAADKEVREGSISPRPESQGRSRSSSVASDRDDDEKTLMKEIRSKSVSSIMVASMYGPTCDSRPLSALDEIVEYTKDEAEALSKIISDDRPQSECDNYADKEEKHLEIKRKMSISPENEVCGGKLSPELSTSGKSSPLSSSDKKSEEKSVVDKLAESLKSQEFQEKIIETISETVVQKTVEKVQEITEKIEKVSEKIETMVEVAATSSKDIPDQLKLTEEKVMGEKSDSGETKTPPTAPVSPGMKATPSTDASAKSSPGASGVTSSDSVSKSIATSYGLGSAGDASEASPQPTSPFPKLPMESSVDNVMTTLTSSTVVSETKVTEEIDNKAGSTTITKTEVITLDKAKADNMQPTGLGDEKIVSDDEVASSPLSATSHASKFTYGDYDLQRSSSGVSKKSEFDLDESQDDIPPQYGSEEVKSAIPISATTYRSDPMSASIYGALPDDEGKTTKFTENLTTTTKVTMESLESKKVGDHKFLDEADLDFEKALEETRQVRGPEVVSNITAKYEYSPSKQPTLTQDEVTTAFHLEDVQKKQVTETTTASASASTTTTSTTTVETEKEKEDMLASWGKPLGLPSPAPMAAENEIKTTPKKERKLIISKTKINNEKNLRKRSESPIKSKKNTSPIYIDLTYVPHHGNSYYTHVEFFKRVRARYYVFSGTEPSRDVYNALLEAKQTWENKDLEVTIIPTYDTDVLGYWVSENEDLLAKYHIDLSPSASRCTINLQDHETSCSAYRLEF
ncbi:hypothetical protein DMENIID0001_065180 [Sergentomyia squamirostris]